jgi:hypothetical protein
MMHSPYLAPPPRSLAEARAELARRIAALPPGSADAAGLAVVLAGIDAVLADRAGRGHAVSPHVPPHAQPQGE